MSVNAMKIKIKQKRKSKSKLNSEMISLVKCMINKL